MSKLIINLPIHNRSTGEHYSRVITIDHDLVSEFVAAYGVEPNVIGSDRYTLDLAHHKHSNKDLQDYLATMGLSIDDYDAELDAWLDDYEPDNGDISARH